VMNSFRLLVEVNPLAHAFPAEVKDDWPVITKTFRRRSYRGICRNALKDTQRGGFFLDLKGAFSGVTLVKRGDNGYQLF